MSERPARPAHEDILWLGDYLPYRLGVVASRMLREAAQVYKRRADPVTTPQFRALAILANHEPLTATEICRLSMLHKVAISRALSQLQRRGLVMRSKILDDRRASHVTLTAQGWRYYTAIVPGDEAPGGRSASRRLAAGPEAAVPDARAIRRIPQERRMYPLAHILQRAVALFADRTAVIDGSVQLSYRQLGERVHRLAGALSRLGLKRGDRVALLDWNSHRYLEAYYACAHAGLAFMPVNSRLAVAELRYVLKDSDARALLFSEPFLPMYEELKGQLEYGIGLALAQAPRRGTRLRVDPRIRAADARGAAHRARRDHADLLHERDHRRAEGGMPHQPQHVCGRPRRRAGAVGHARRQLAAFGAAVPSRHVVRGLVDADRRRLRRSPCTSTRSAQSRASPSTR